MNDTRVSTYELIYPLEGDTAQALLVNGLYGAFDIVTAEEAAILRSARQDAPALNALSPETRERLRLRGHLVTEDAEEELENLRILFRMYRLLYSQNSMNLVLLPTYNCNFRCEYCFERKRLEKGNEWLSRVMTRETVDAVFRQVESERARGVKLHGCMLYGGEPLLRANRSIIEYICQRCQALQMPISCITNGYDLDAYVDLLDQYKFTCVLVTVDGLQPVHDARRHLAGGQGTYERIMRNIEMALRHDVNILLHIIVNRANLDGAMLLPEEFRRRGFLDNRCFQYNFKTTYGSYEDDPANVLTNWELFQRLCAEGICTRENYQVSARVCDVAECVKRFLTKEDYNLYYPTYCGAEKDLICVDPEGVLYSCVRTVSQEQYAVGITDVERGRFLYHFDLSKWRTRTVDFMPDCQKCPYLIFCGGGCACESITLYGDIRRGCCGDVRETFDYIAPSECEKAYRQTGECSLNKSMYDLFRDLTKEERAFLLTTTDAKKVYMLVKGKLQEGVNP